MSKIGLIIFWAKLDLANIIPIGIPNVIEIKVETNTKDIVYIVLVHKPNKPTNKKYNITITDNLIFLVKKYVKKEKQNNVMGQGVCVNNFSNQIIKYKSGSKKDSIESP